MSFKENYSEFYDILYQDKDYKSEAQYIDHLIKKHFIGNNYQNSKIRLLDLACGTGKHVFELANLGYQAEGSDISEQMIDVAKRNAKKSDNETNFYNYSFQESNYISKKYEIVISMFSAFNYLVSYNDVIKTLQNIYNLLEKQGIFIFDYWNGNAVVRDYSPVKVLRKQNGKDEILRISDTMINIIEQTATVNFTCMKFTDSIKILEFNEVHKLKYYYFQEIESILNSCNFKIIHKSTFMKPDESINPYDWNISIVAQKQ